MCCVIESCDTHEPDNLFCTHYRLTNQLVAGNATVCVHMRMRQLENLVIMHDTKMLLSA